MNQQYGASAYARVGIESKVLNATPLELICLLYEGAIKQIQRAKLFIESGQVNERCEAIGKAIDIVGGLNAALVIDEALESTQNLSDLYDFMSKGLVRANIHSDPEILDQISGILESLLESWREAGIQVGGKVA